MNFKYIVFICLLAFSLFSCRSTDKKKEDMDSEVKQTGTDLQAVKKEAEDGYFEEFQLFKEQAQGRLNKIETRVEELKKALPKNDADASAAYRKSIADAEHQNTVLRKKLAEFNEEGKDKLWKFEKEFGQQLNDLEQTVADINKYPGKEK
ncbi:MAG TPA: hypothetical protein VGO45_08095 [Bacteroidia bacterium]|jgi:Skp family chaperone for outer membrane proteins|nr:hypothetical protein [Bacteroidia bacterium]